MSNINWGRVIGGGLLAGLVMNIGQTLLNAVVLAEASAELAKRMNLEPPGGAQIGLFVLLTFLLGITLVWFYAAIRPRYGPGPKTAICAALAVCFLARLLPTIIYAVGGMLTVNIALIAGAWSVAELILAALAGAWVYKES